MSEMPQSASQTHDRELGLSDIQSLSNADEITAFFARLGYNTDPRISQTPANLGITAEGTARPIKKIELIADQESLFQVYLFELTSVTIAHTRALARTFRNRAGNYLLVLTSDYERLDFVLLEKYVPAESNGSSTIAQRQVGVRPRVLTVERRKPTRLQLRVLRRFTWTESDPFAQYEKLLSAYAVADWSEEFFNNRALFSDYYLLERLRERPEWTADPKPAYSLLRQLYEGAASLFSGRGESVLRKELLEPALQVLGFEARPGKKSGSSAVEPDYRLYSPAMTSGRTRGSPLQQTPRALGLVYSWGRSLDGKDDQRDKETAEENPGAVVVSLLEGGEAPWVLVTNGKLWRLYAQRTHSRATNYYEIDLEEVLAQAGPYAADPAEAFRYFWLLFRRQAFEPVEVEREGKPVALSLLDQLFLESEDYAKELGERLKERVFGEVFPHLAAGFIAYIQSVEARRAAPLQQNELDAIFQGTLTLLYRLLFLLYAEARDLLPVKEIRGYFEASLTKLKREVAEAASSIADEVEERLKRHYRDDCYELYERLTRLFQMVDKGEPASNVPVYNGGLFLSNPEDQDKSQEARAARFLNTTRVPDRFLARALDLLARDVDSKRHDLVFIDYKSLGVRQLGSIYEGLLEFKLRIADRKLAIVKEKGHEVYAPFSDLDERERERADRQGRIIRKGHVYLENDKRERKATGSYYTPDYIVQYIVEHAVGPVLQEKFETMRPKLREAQKWHRDMMALAKAKGEPTSKYEFGPAVEHKWGGLVKELFNVKVLDPAMGSGHFLVEAVDYITDKALDFLNAFPWNPVVAYLSRMRETILREMDEQGITIDAKRLTDVNLLKRHVLKRCIYGVDLNPMAVELAKVSLWLDCFTLGAPLSFLDHHLRCGNSLIGVTVKEVREALEGKAGEAFQLDLFGSRFAGLLLATDLMRHVGELSDVTSAQVQESRSEYRKASDALAPFKRILDVYTSQWFGNGNNNVGARHASPKSDVGARRRRAQSDPLALAFLKSRAAEAFINARDDNALKQVFDKLSPSDRPIAETALTAASEKRFFHWELEFPEVFYGPRSGTTQAIERLEGAGFDAVVGNPPWGAAFDNRDKDFTKIHFSTAVSVTDSYLVCTERGLMLLRQAGRLGFIIPDAWLSGIKYREFRLFVGLKNHIHSVVDLPYDVFDEAYVDCLLLVASNEADSNSAALITVFGAKDSVPEDWRAWKTKAFPYKDWVAHIENQLDLRSTGSDIFGRMETISIPLSQIADIDRGLEAYGQKTPPSVRKARGYHSQTPCSQKDWIRQFTGELRRYELNFTDPLYVRLGSHLAECPAPEFFTEDRILLRRLISRQFRLMACEVRGEEFANDSSTLNLIRFRGYARLYILALLNSFLFSYRQLSQSSIARRDDYPKISLYEAKAFPIRRIDFSTPEGERKQRSQDLISRYCTAINTLGQIEKANISDPSAWVDFLAIVSGATGTLRIPVDVLHDILAYLAEQMIELNKQKQAESKQFLGWLEKELKIQPDKNGNTGIEALTGKITLKDYLGDYQKGEEHTPFEALWEVLRKNTRRIGRTLDSAFEQRMRAEHEKSLTLLLPIKQKLTATDWLIDQLVYRLYGLTEEEIAIVERRE